MQERTRCRMTVARDVADGSAVRAAVEAGAQGIVAAGFAPGLVPPVQLEALNEAARAGIAVVHGFVGPGADGSRPWARRTRTAA